MSMAGTQVFKCPQCDSSELCFGYQGTASNVFVPSGVFTFHGYKTRAFVCLKCGSLSHYIPKDRLAKLKEKFKELFE